MAKVYVFLANGFEDIEAMAPVDILRRGGVEVVTVSITGAPWAESSHGVTMMTDVQFEDIEHFDDADLLMLPGGMPGAAHLNEHAGLRQLLVDHNARQKRIGAICAAPMVLGTAGLLKGRRATAYPGTEEQMEGADYTGELVTVDGNITTAKGPAAAMLFGFCLLSQLTSEAKAEEIKNAMLANELAARN